MSGSEDPLHVERIAADQIRPLIELEQRSCCWPWSENSLRNSLAQGHYCLVGKSNNNCICYAVLMHTERIIEILNIVVFSQFQGMGFGSKFLSLLIEFSKQRGAETMWLEVRQSNKVATRMYHTAGFLSDGIRPKYYPLENGEREPGILMQRTIQPSRQS